VLFDAIAGGDVTDKLISNLPSAGGALHVWKIKQSENLVVSRAFDIFGRIPQITSVFDMFEWLATVSQEELEKIRSSHSICTEEGIGYKFDSNNKTLISTSSFQRILSQGNLRQIHDSHLI
jgi:hypothetical protein